MDNTDSLAEITTIMGSVFGYLFNILQICLNMNNR